MRTKVAPLYLELLLLQRPHYFALTKFHRVFKDIAGDSPLQYIKKTKLATARDLIEQQGMCANIAAQAVGYESVSQFSREFKWQYNISPSKLKA